MRYCTLILPLYSSRSALSSSPQTRKRFTMSKSRATVTASCYRCAFRSKYSTSYGKPSFIQVAEKKTNCYLARRMYQTALGQSIVYRSIWPTASMSSGSAVLDCRTSSFTQARCDRAGVKRTTVLYSCMVQVQTPTRADLARTMSLDEY